MHSPKPFVPPVLLCNLLLPYLVLCILDRLEDPRKVVEIPLHVLKSIGIQLIKWRVALY